MVGRPRMTVCLSLLVALSVVGCAPAPHEPAPRSPSLGDVDPTGRPTTRDAVTRLNLPPYLLGYPAITDKRSNRWGRSPLRATAADRPCGNHVQRMFPSSARGQHASALPEGDAATVATGTYLLNGRPVLWAAMETGGSRGSPKALRQLRSGRGACREVDYVIHVGGLRIYAARLRVGGHGELRLLWAPGSGDSILLAACRRRIGDSQCSAAMLELVHVTGL